MSNQSSYPKSAYLKSLLYLLLFLIVFETLLFIIAGLRPSYWGDETHFVETIEEFGEEISIQKLKHYNEMSTPLPFILYALWGRLWGFEIVTLRLFSLIIALATYLLFHLLVYSLFRKQILAVVATLFLMLQPYMIGLSIFVFTDMLTILFLITAVISIRKENSYLLLVSNAGGLLCRQYFIFFTLAAGIYYMLRFFSREKKRENLKMVTSLAISLFPLIFLFILWQGFSPENARKTLYIDEAFYFHPDFLVLYVSLFFVYLLPLVIYYRKYFYGKPFTLILALILSGSYALFPVRASEPAIEVNIHTVGFFHKFIRYVMGARWEDVVFYVAFLLGLPVLLSILSDFWKRLNAHDFHLAFFFDLSIILFLIIMPFSYLVWEKYFLPVIPLAALHIFLTNEN